MGSIGGRGRQRDDEILLRDYEARNLDSWISTTRAGLAKATFEWVLCWYNTERRHSGI